MILIRRRLCMSPIVLMLLVNSVVSAQPTLPDITGNTERGMVLLSWTCQFDGVKSIAVLRSSDSNYNYSTVGYVRKLYKGVQAFADGHPMPGKNFYKLSIVFNSGLTWGSNHYGVYADSATIYTKTPLISNEALQKLIVTEQPDKAVKTENQKPRKYPSPANSDKYIEVFRKDSIASDMPQLPKHNFKTDRNNEDDLSITSYLEQKKKIIVTYQDDTIADPVAYITDGKMTKEDQPKKISVTFDNKDDVSTFVDNLPKSPDRKITVTYTENPNDLNPAAYINEYRRIDTLPKKISITFKDDDEVHAYMETIPKLSNSKITISYTADSNEIKAKMKPVDIHSPMTTALPAKKTDEPPMPKLSIHFRDEPATNSATTIRSKYVLSDPATGHIKMTLPDDINSHHYSVKFYDNENHMVVEIPKINTARIILDKRNFQKKGMYKFTLKKDGLELETGYVNIY